MLAPLLAQRAAQKNPIRVGVIGTGKFGGGLVAQVSRMQGMEISAIADINLERARQAYTASDTPAETIRSVANLSDLNDAIKGGRPCVTQDGLLLTAADQLDVIVEATGLPEVGARMAYETLQHNKHLVMVNVETDVTIGPLLRRHADSAGVVYSLVDGDQPGCTMNIIDWARALGFEIVAAGRGTTYYDDDFSGTPDSVPQRFGFDQATLERRTINLKMYNSFRDGTKAQVEMTALANMAGLVPDVRGMHEPSVNIRDIARVFSRQDEGGILSRHGVVELANSVAQDGRTLLDDPLRMGVFTVIRTDHPFTREDLATYDLHPGADNQNFLLYRPYHLVAVEAPITIAQAVLHGQPTGTPLPTPTAEVITVAKRDLKAGEILDGGGGYTVNGLCEKAEIARQQDLLPLGLSSGAQLKTNAAKGTAITYAMVDLKEDSFVLKLRRIQDATVW
jgi:predicted homoserine dehydrogenase-like protein